ncbi:MAG: hypothetical protein AB7O24_14625 [Kofleriaceae bacterium]
MTVAIWLGGAVPARSVRWLDGAVAASAILPDPIAVAAGPSTWLDLAADRANRAGIASVGVPIDMQLDYLGWAQVVAAIVKHLAADIVVVDEASRPGRFAETAAIAELLEAAQLSHVTALATDRTTLHATSIVGGQRREVRIAGRAVIGVRIAGAWIDEYPTPTPSATMKRLDVGSLGLDPVTLGHRAMPPRASQEPTRSLERVAEQLAAHLRSRV